MLLGGVRLLFSVLSVRHLVGVLFGGRVSLSPAVVVVGLDAVVASDAVLNVLTLFFLVPLVFACHQECGGLEYFLALCTESILKF